MLALRRAFHHSRRTAQNIRIERPNVELDLDPDGLAASLDPFTGLDSILGRKVPHSAKPKIDLENDFADIVSSDAGVETNMGLHFRLKGDCMARTVIQIAADPSYLYALCNDGEIFRLVNHVWQPMPPIPQDDPRDTSAKPKPGFIQIADEPGG